MTKKFDAIVLDIMMRADEAALPGSSKESGLIGGIRLQESIVTNEKSLNRTTPILFLTGLLTNEHPRIRDAEKKLGPRFLVKPIRVDALYEAIINAIRTK